MAARTEPPTRLPMTRTSHSSDLDRSPIWLTSFTYYAPHQQRLGRTPCTVKPKRSWPAWSTAGPPSAKASGLASESHRGRRIERPVRGTAGPRLASPSELQRSRPVACVLRTICASGATGDVSESSSDRPSGNGGVRAPVCRQLEPACIAASSTTHSMVTSSHPRSSFARNSSTSTCRDRTAQMDENRQPGVTTAFLVSSSDVVPRGG
jgi:hypothetical protein